MIVVTWNMQGATSQGENKWRADVKRLFNAGVNVACLQECGSPPPGAAVIDPPAWLGGEPPDGVDARYLFWNSGTETRPFIIYIFWLHSDQGGNRNNLAIASVGVQPINLLYAAPGIAGGRPAIGAGFARGGDVTENICTLHAFSGNGNDGPGLLANINAIAEAWFTAGDYNCAPTTWGVPSSQSPHVYPAGTNYCPHDNVATYPSSGADLDYAFRNPGPTVIGKVNTNFVASDHFPVFYQI